MQGWSQFKQGRLEEALQSFFGVLDLKIADRDGGAELESIKGLSRAERELVEDTFRVTSLSLANLQGAESIPPHITNDRRKSYEFRVYQQLGELYLKQERTKDAADTLGAFARRQPLHEQAPVLQARVIDIYQQTGFPTLALEAKKEYVSRYGVDSEFRKANPAGWEKAQPLVKTHLTELARHFHASAQKSKSSADYQEAVRWYRMYIASFPNDPETAQNNFLLAELLFEDSKLRARPPSSTRRRAYGYPKHAKSADAGYAALLAYAGAGEARRRGRAGRRCSGRASTVRCASPKAFPDDSRTRAGADQRRREALRAARQRARRRRRAAGAGAQAAGHRRRSAASRGRWSRTPRSRRARFADAEKAYGEVLALTPAEPTTRAATSSSAWPHRSTSRASRRVPPASAARRSATSRGSRRWRRSPRCAPPRSTTPPPRLIALKDWDGAAQSARGLPHALPEPPAGRRGRQQARGGLPREGQLGAGRRRDGTPRGQSEDRPEDRARRAVAGRRAVREGRLARPAAAKAYERYLKQYPQPLEPAVEARWRLAKIAKADGNASASWR